MEPPTSWSRAISLRRSTSSGYLVAVAFVGTATFALSSRARRNGSSRGLFGGSASGSAGISFMEAPSAWILEHEKAANVFSCRWRQLVHAFSVVCFLRMHESASLPFCARKPADPTRRPADRRPRHPLPPPRRLLLAARVIRRPAPPPAARRPAVFVDSGATWRSSPATA